LRFGEIFMYCCNRTRGTLWGNEKCIQNFGRKPLRDEATSKT
jgi:hypothetical protein